MTKIIIQKNLTIIRENNGDGPEIQVNRELRMFKRRVKYGLENELKR